MNGSREQTGKEVETTEIADPILAALAVRIYRLRTGTSPRHRITQAALARAIGCKKHTINQIERGKMRKVPHQHLIALAEYFEVTIDYLLGRDHVDDVDD